MRQFILGPESVALESNTRIVVLIDLSKSTNVILRFCKYSDKSLNSFKVSDKVFKLLTNTCYHFKQFTVFT